MRGDKGKESAFVFVDFLGYMGVCFCLGKMCGVYGRVLWFCKDFSGYIGECFGLMCFVFFKSSGRRVQAGMPILGTFDIFCLFYWDDGDDTTTKTVMKDENCDSEDCAGGGGGGGWKMVMTAVAIQE